MTVHQKKREFVPIIMFYYLQLDQLFLILSSTCKRDSTDLVATISNQIGYTFSQIKVLISAYYILGDETKFGSVYQLCATTLA